MAYNKILFALVFILLKSMVAGSIISSKVH